MKIVKLKAENIKKLVAVEIEAMARDKDYQVWMEVVDESGKVGIVIENGAVSAVNGGSDALHE